MKICIPASLLEQLRQQACATPEVEICGLIVARNGQPVRCIQIRNIAEQPRQHFNMEPREQIAAFRQLREQGEELFAIYHSHPDGPAAPSATDIREAGYPDALQLIIAPHQDGSAEIRGYYFRDGRAAPAEIDALDS
ncbi:MAG: M67 family metallopeptidase [Thiogranum sp.]|nr:M67 family metallopeptidase [Thiogranum sp.]